MTALPELTEAEANELERVFADPDHVEVHGSDTKWAKKVVTILQLGAGVIDSPEGPAEQPSAAPSGGTGASPLRDAILGGRTEQDRDGSAAPRAV